jgi:hypothetical protein
MYNKCMKCEVCGKINNKVRGAYMLQQEWLCVHGVLQERWPCD